MPGSRTIAAMLMASACLGFDGAQGQANAPLVLHTI